MSKNLNLVSREYKQTDTVVAVGACKIGDQGLTLIAGPCCVESWDQMDQIARAVKASGAQILRGGAFKPRTSPYSFQGMGLEGLKLLREAGDRYHMPVITELMSEEDFDAIHAYTDIIQIGARSMQNFSLLKRVGSAKIPVMLKRGMSNTLEEFLMSAEYIMASGNHHVILCERGIRTFENYTRNTLDLGAVCALKQLSHLPVIVDPSHATGRWELVEPVSRAAVAAGAHGLMIEVHHMPDQALSDGPQSLLPHKFDRLVHAVHAIHRVCLPGEIQSGSGF